MRLPVSLSAILLFGGAVHAAGYSFPDLGARQLARGGTGAASGGEVGALYYNPAALLGAPLSVQFDGMMLLQHIDFQRVSPNGSAGHYDQVSNAAGPFANTLSGAAWTRSRDGVPLFAVAAGIYGPSANGHLLFPDPAGRSPNNVLKQTPQRYELIESNIIVLYPTLAMAWRPLSWLDVGIAYSVRSSTTDNTLTLYAAPTSGEDPEWDARAQIKTHDFGYRLHGPWSGDSKESTGRLNVGLLVRPPGLDGFSIGLSGHPSEAINATGTLNTVPPDNAKIVQARVIGDSISVLYNYAAEARLGVRYATSNWAVEFDTVYEGWSALKRFHVEPHGMKIEETSGGKTTTQDVAPIDIEKDWRDVFSLRAGGEWRPHGGPLTLRLGALVEPSAIPTSTLSVDFPNTESAGVSIGAEYAVTDHLTVALAYERLISPTQQIRDSQIIQPVAQAGVTPQKVGNGDLNASLDYFSVGIGYTFAAP